MADGTLFTNSNGEIISENGVLQTSAPISIVDDFEDNDKKEYNVTSGGDGSSIVSSPVFSGSYALSMNGYFDLFANATTIQSSSGLENYPSAGDTISYYFRYSSSVFDDPDSSTTDPSSFLFADQDSSTEDSQRYEVSLRGYSLKLRRRNSDGTITVLADTSISTSAGVWYFLEINWGSNGSFTVTISDTDGNQIGEVTANDSNYSSGGIGFQSVDATNQGDQYYDKVVIE